MRHYYTLAALIGATLLLSACGVKNHFSNKAPQLVAEPDAVSAMLANAADRAAMSLEKLAAVEYERSPGVAVAPIGNAPIEMRRAITVQWVGPVEPIVKNLAERASYNFIVVGSTPPIPVVVSINADNMPVIEVLRDIGLQLGTRADVRVDGQRRIVEIHYAPTTGIGY